MNPYMMAYAACTMPATLLDMGALMVILSYFGVKGEENSEMVLLLINLAFLYCTYLWISFICQLEHRLPASIAQVIKHAALGYAVQFKTNAADNLGKANRKAKEKEKKTKKTMSNQYRLTRA